MLLGLWKPLKAVVHEELMEQQQWRRCPRPPMATHGHPVRSMQDHVATSWWHWTHFEAVGLCALRYFGPVLPTWILQNVEFEQDFLWHHSPISTHMERRLERSSEAGSRCRAPSERESGCNFMQCRQKLFVGFGWFWLVEKDAFSGIFWVFEWTCKNLREVSLLKEVASKHCCRLETLTLHARRAWIL